MQEQNCEVSWIQQNESLECNTQSSVQNLTSNRSLVFCTLIEKEDILTYNILTQWRLCNTILSLYFYISEPNSLRDTCSICFVYSTAQSSRERLLRGSDQSQCLDLSCSFTDISTLREFDYDPLIFLFLTQTIFADCDIAWNVL